MKGLKILAPTCGCRDGYFNLGGRLEPCTICNPSGHPMDAGVAAERPSQRVVARRKQCERRRRRLREDSRCEQCAKPLDGESRSRCTSCLRYQREHNSLGIR